MGVRLYLLGAPRVEQEGDRVTFDTRKALALLAYLAVDAERHRREALATLLWPEYEQDRAFANLRRTLWSLKQGIGEASLEIDTEFVALKREHLWLDVDAFRAHLAASDAHEHDDAVGCAECLESLRAAVACYEGDFLSGFTLPDSPLFDEWCFFQAESLRQELAGALARVVQVYRARQQPQAALPQARRWVALDPLHEPAHRALMQLYAQAGRRTAALRQYRECARILADELGVSPAAETTRLYEQIQTGTLPVVEPRRLLVPTSTVPSAQLPVFLESGAAQPVREDEVFVGRERQLAALEAHLAAARRRQQARFEHLPHVTTNADTRTRAGRTTALHAARRRRQRAHEDGHQPARFERASLPPRAQAGPHDCGPGRRGADRHGPPGRGAAVSPAKRVVSR